jgi:hypothetical protein
VTVDVMAAKRDEERSRSHGARVVRDPDRDAIDISDDARAIENPCERLEVDGAWRLS